jgi:hypothetical protein
LRRASDGLSAAARRCGPATRLDSRSTASRPCAGAEQNAEAIIAEYQGIAARITTHPDNTWLVDRGR